MREAQAWLRYRQFAFSSTSIPSTDEELCAIFPTERERKNPSLTAGPIILRSSCSTSVNLSNAVVAAVGAEPSQTYLSTADTPFGFAAARCTREYALHCRTQTLTFVQVQTGSPERERARLPPPVSSSASFTASCSTSSLFKLLVHTHISPCSPRSPRRAPGPPITHPLRRASISRTSLRRCRPLNPFRTGKPPSVLHVHIPHFCRLQHFFRICVEAATATAAEGPIRLHWRLFAIGVLIRAGRPRARAMDTAPPGPRNANAPPATAPRAVATVTAVRTGAPTPKKGVRRRPALPRATPHARRRGRSDRGGRGKGWGAARGRGGSRGGWVNEGESGAGPKASEDMKVGDAPYALRCLTRLCLAPEGTLAGCLGSGPGVVSSLGFSPSCGGVRRASVGRSRLGICSPPPAFPGPPQAHTRTSFSARDPASAPASASPPPYKTSHGASSSACARIPTCPHPAYPDAGCHTSTYVHESDRAILTWQ
ncbi:hypothetical protein DFH08DRAFT_1089314 [Mycena albidolilacea]|uniref:Uncharacterized protein n=1 Tax=Mycena albidolilacea TaxID=1033008 RepID=A0AAD6Z2E4_9AGAR|nr:hypothetical protein DFH08DRAFT_1089314 [Mycena albidolilacea]